LAFPCDPRPHSGHSRYSVALRIAGILYLIIFVAAPSGAENATFAKLSITLACDAGVALLFYNLFRPVNKNLSLLAAVFRLIFVAVMTVNSLNYFGLLDRRRVPNPLARGRGR
jgi:hypothetical protein